MFLRRKSTRQDRSLYFNLAIKISCFGTKFIGEEMKPQAMGWPEAYFLDVRTRT
jgi:hypothetical protein